MVLATAGWAVWWVTFVLARWAPGWAPGLPVPASSLVVAAWVAFAVAAVGFLMAVFTLRARRVWVLLAAVPMFANGSLMLLPWIADDMAGYVEYAQEGLRGS